MVKILFYTKKTCGFSGILNRIRSRYIRQKIVYVKSRYTLINRKILSRKEKNGQKKKTKREGDKGRREREGGQKGNRDVLIEQNQKIFVMDDSLDLDGVHPSAIRLKVPSTEK